MSGVAIVVFCDLVDSTALLARLGDDRMEAPRAALGFSGGDIGFGWEVGLDYCATPARSCGACARTSTSSSSCRGRR